MKKIVIISILLFSSYGALSAESAPCGDYGECEIFSPQLENLESLQLGAVTFLNNCYGCHSLQYSRWNRVAKDLEIPEQIFSSNLVYGQTVKLGNRMTGSMDKATAESWFGIAPPDLTLVTRLHGSDWVYTYLKTFYEDASKPYGVITWFTRALLCRMYWHSCKGSKFCLAKIFLCLLQMEELKEMSWATI